MARQKELKGIEAPKFPQLDDAMETYFEAAKNYGKAGKKVATAKETLIEVATDLNVKSYTDNNHSPPLSFSMTDGKVMLKVREAGKGEPDDDDEKPEELP